MSNLIVQVQQQLDEKGAEAFLPRNLSDFWIGKLIEAVNDGLDIRDKNEKVTFAPVLLVLFAFKYAKEGRKMEGEIKVDPEEIFAMARDYQIELALEEIHRRTDVKYEPATLETIFTKRAVNTWREPG